MASFLEQKRLNPGCHDIAPAWYGACGIPYTVTIKENVIHEHIH
jgi:hypothetical protein